MIRRLIIGLGVLPFVLCFSGCALTCYREAKGPLFFRLTFGTDQQVGPVDLQSATGRLRVGGVTTSQAAAAGTITEAALNSGRIQPRNPEP